MQEIDKIVETLAGYVRNPRARCVIDGGDGHDEASLMGTKDGYINLAIAILELVSRCENPSPCGDSTDPEDPSFPPYLFYREDDEMAFWSDRIPYALNAIPRDVQIIGCYVFDTNDRLMDKLKTSIDPLVINDPDFYEG